MICGRQWLAAAEFSHYWANSGGSRSPINLSWGVRCVNRKSSDWNQPIGWHSCLALTFSKFPWGKVFFLAAWWGAWWQLAESSCLLAAAAAAAVCGRDDGTVCTSVFQVCGLIWRSPTAAPFSWRWRPRWTWRAWGRRGRGSGSTGRSGEPSAFSLQ